MNILTNVLSGLFGSECAMVEPEASATDDETAERLWNLTVKLMSEKRKEVEAEESDS